MDFTSLFTWVPSPQFLFAQLLNGLTRSMLLFLVSSGLTLILGVMGVVNFAHGSLYMLGAYGSFTLGTLLGGAPSSFLLAVAVVPLGIALVGGVIERLLLRRIYRAEGVMQILLTYAVVLMVADLVRLIWGPETRGVPKPTLLAGAVTLLGSIYPSYNLLILILGPLVAFGLWFLLYQTIFGKVVRATALDREMANALGINVPMIFTMVFMLGAWLAGLAGVLAAPIGAITPTMDLSIIVESFVVVVIGGLGSFWGALLGALIVGVVQAYGILIVPRMALISIFVIMALVLILRPWGLLGNPRAPLAR